MSVDTCVRRAAAVLCAVCVVVASPEEFSCVVRTRIDSGCVCGLSLQGDGGVEYASFLGVPYAKQPLGELRFKELQPIDPWQYAFNATEEGPVCHQTDVVYGRILQPRNVSEACIHANIYVPIEALPQQANQSCSSQRDTRRLQPHYRTGFTNRQNVENKGLPILVSVHGGGFQGGSGDPDLHGPEYLVSKKVIVITFNYRLNAFGFLSLNSTEIPGNQGLRDMVTLLRWVQRNAKAFGGDPDNVTLMGQSAGAVSVHLLTLSKATEHLYKRAFLMSGTATSSFYSYSPILAQQLSNIFLATLGINSTDSAEDIHRQLVYLPIEKINEANRIMLDQFGLSTFVPTVESAFPGVTRVLDEDPEVLIAKGHGKDVPLVIGFTNVECEVFRRRLDQINIASKIIDNPMFTVPSNVIFTTLPEFLPDIAKRIDQKYYNGTVDTDGFIKYCTDAYFKYPALKLAEQRAASGGSPVFLYEFSYDSDNSVLKEALDLHYKGAAHIEDLTYLFRVNSVLGNIGSYGSYPLDERDGTMKDWMIKFLTNFMMYSEPVSGEKSEWPPVRPKRIQLQEIREPSVYRLTDLTMEQLDILQFFDSLRSK